jgi:hypothetical protein
MLIVCDNAVVSFDVETMTHRIVYSVQDESILSGVVLPNRTLVLLTDYGSSFEVLDLDTAEVVRKVKTRSKYNSIGLSPDGSVITGTSRSHIDLLDADAFDLLVSFPVDGIPVSVVMGNDNSICYVFRDHTSNYHVVHRDTLSEGMEENV